MAPSLSFPSIYLLATHLSEDDVRRLGEDVASLTADASKADVFVGKVSRTERAKLELRHIGIVTIDERRPRSKAKPTAPTPAAKRRKLGERTPSPIVISSSSEDEGVSPVSVPPGSPLKVVKLAWLTDSIAAGQVLPMASYVVYEGRRIRTELTRDKPAPHPQPPTSLPPPPRQQHRAGRPSRRKTFGTPGQRPSLVRTSTSEHDAAGTLPRLPDFLHSTYSCQRPTPLHPPNEKFVDVLKRIRSTRQLVGDKIGIRAYSTAIATISAYPYKLAVPAEVNRLPGCGPKIAALFRQFLDSGGHVREAEDAEADAKMAVLRLFCNIWGVAEATARSFYNRGWRDLDDVIDLGWKDLLRVQQIGVKYYDEFQEKLTRTQVEAIAHNVLRHANGIRPGYQMVIAGGYRRGKELSGDVDVILSHPDAAATSHFVSRLVVSLEEEGLVQHTLVLSTANSDRGQEAVSYKGAAVGGTGFDTLDKALVVWQDAMEDTTDTADRNSNGKDGEGEGESAGGDGPPRCNTNPRRRVDIIVSPWKTVGCAVLGWSGGTTFQRDLRLYCKHEKGLRFDSSGARSRADGSYVDLEDFASNPAPDMLAAERRVFDALGLEFRPPNERCTG